LIALNAVTDRKHAMEYVALIITNVMS